MEQMEGEKQRTSDLAAGIKGLQAEIEESKGTFSRLLATWTVRSDLSD